MADRPLPNLRDWEDRADEPAAPKGMAQSAATVAQGGGRFANSWVGQQVAERGYVSAAESWYTGQNREGTKNGWDTDFWDRAMAQNKEFGEQGRLNTQFEDEHATGVVTWDHASEDGKTQFKFGDVYDNGDYRGNVFEKFDRGTANVMMADLLFDGRTKAEIFEDSPTGVQGGVPEFDSNLDKEVQAKREENNVNIPKALTAAQFNEDVQERATQMREGGVDELITAGGVAGGLLTAGGAAAATGVGLIPGLIMAGAGATVGGVGAWMNRDALTEQAARAAEITDLAYAENSSGSAFFTGVQQWSGFGGKLISPLSNTVQGITDVAYGRGGDGTSEFYRTDADGDGKVSSWLKVADVTATVGDSLLQFSSPLGAGLFRAQMTGTIVGEVGELTLTGGEAFNYSTGDFDNIFTDDEGHTDWLQGAAGIGKVGIDAVQLGTAQGLMSKMQSQRAMVGQDAVTGLMGRTGKALYGGDVYGGVGTRAAEWTASRLPKWAGGYGKEAAEAVATIRAAGGEAKELAGRKFWVNAETGEAVAQRKTLSILAPSEQLSSLSARVIGMREAARRSGAYTTDDFYRAAQSLSVGERKIQAALVNGMGEGYEEAVQAVLEPYSHGDAVSMESIAQSAVYGFAAGVGMQLGMNIHAPSADDKRFALGQASHYMATGETMSRRDWNKLTQNEKDTLSAMTGLTRETAQAALKKIQNDQSANTVANFVGANKLADAINTHYAKALQKASPRTDGAFVITQLEDAGRVDRDGNITADSIPSDGVGSSTFQLAQNLNAHQRGLAVQSNMLGKKVQDLTTRLAETPDNQDLAAQLQDAQGKLEQVSRTLEWSKRFNMHVDESLASMYDQDADGNPVVKSYAEVSANTQLLNQLLRDAFNENLNQLQDLETGQTVRLDKQARRDLARAVSLVFARDPHDSATSYQVLVPQASAQLTLTNSNNMLEISHALLPGLRGDYDGDKIRQLAQLVLDDAEYVSMRSGDHYIGAGASVNVGITKYEKYVVDTLGLALKQENSALAAYATNTLVDIGLAIKGRYRNLQVAPSVIDNVLAQFNEAMHAGKSNARQVLLDGLAAGMGNQLQTFARENLSNEWLWIDQVVKANLQTFQEAFAAQRPDDSVTPEVATVLTPHRQSREIQERRATRAATIGQTVGLWLAGDTMFRKSQKLHYGALVAAVKSAMSAGTRENLADLAQRYEALGQGLTRTELAALRGKDDITARVYLWLEKLSEEAAADISRALGTRLPKGATLPVLANTLVLDMEVNENGQFEPNSSGQKVSLAQLLLKKSIQIDKREKSAIIEAMPELEAKYNRLEAMTRPGSRGFKDTLDRGKGPVNAERAFIEVIGSQQLYTLLGEDANIFGPQLTVEQFIREYVSKSEDARKQLDHALRSDAAYVGKKTSKDIPYELDEMRDGGISPYRAIVDSILAVGHNRITIDKNGVLHGEFAEKSARTSATFRETVQLVQRAMRQFRMNSPKEGESKEQTVARMLDANPDFARRLMDLIPDAAAQGVFEMRGRELYIADWFYKTFTLRPKAAEMHYWRNVLISQWRAKGLSDISNNEETEDGQRGREWSRLGRRMHRVMFNLAARDDGGIAYQMFLDKMMKADDLDAFIKWANTTPGVRGDQAPFTAWVDDTGDFDKDKASGGWGSVLAGAELREAIGMLRVSSEKLLENMVTEKQAITEDRAVLTELRRIHQLKTADPQAQLSQADQDLYLGFTEAIKQAGERNLGMGPQAMIYQIVATSRGFYPQAHAKGVNPDFLDAAGAFEAMRDAYDYVTNYERLMGGLTAVNLDAVGGNLGMTAKDAGRTMDDNGRQVTWDTPSPGQMLDWLENPDTRAMARDVIFPQVLERSGDGATRTQLLVGRSLTDLFRGTAHADLFAKNNRFSHDQALRYVSAVEAEARKHGGHFSVQRLANDLVIARTSGARHTLSTFELEQMAVDALYEIARVLQMTGARAASSTNTPGVDPLQELRDQVKETQRAVRESDLLGLSGENKVLSKDILDALVADKEKELLDDVARLEEDVNTAGPAGLAEAERHAESARADYSRFKEKVQLIRNDDMMHMVLSMFSFTSDPISAQSAKQDALVNYIQTHMSVMERASSSTVTLMKLNGQLYDHGRAGQLDLTDDEWRELSRAVMGVYVDDMTALSGAGVAAPPFPDMSKEAGQAQARYFDVSFSYLIDPLMDYNSPLVKAAARIHRLAGRQGDYTELKDVTDTEIVKLVGDTIFKDGSLGTWTSDIVRASQEANQRLDSAAAPQAIAMAGNSPKRQAVISAATRRTFRVPPAELLSSVNLTWLGLGKDDFDDVDVMMLPTSTATVKMPKVMLDNRFAKTVEMKYVDPVAGVVTIDLLAQDRNVGWLWDTNDQAATSGYYEIHTDRIKQAVSKAIHDRGLNPADVGIRIDFFHPDNQPVLTEQEVAAGAESWYNNLFFEGTSFNLGFDRQESLNSTLWFASGGINPVAQQAALDATKLGNPALTVIKGYTADDVKTVEANYLTDFAGMLRRKTEMMMTADLGMGTPRLDPAYYNATYKNLKLRHFVRGKDAEGATVVWTSEQMVAWQQANPPGTVFPIQDPELWIPSDTVLRSLLGEQGGQGVARVFLDQFDVDLSAVPRYNGVTPDMISKFATGFDGDKVALHETNVVHRGRQQQLTVRGYLKPSDRQKYDARVRYYSEQRQQIESDRGDLLGNERGFKPWVNLSNALKFANKALKAENIQLSWDGAGLPWIAPMVEQNSALSEYLLSDLASAMQGSEHGVRAGWIVRHGGDASINEGIINEASIGGLSKGKRVAHKDLAVLDIATYGGLRPEAEKMLDYLMNTGAYVVLGAGPGEANMRAELSTYLEANGYERVNGSQHLYQPIQNAPRFANLRARESTLMEMRGVSSRSHMAILHVLGLPIEENAAWIHRDNKEAPDVRVALNLVPTDFLAGYNVPADQSAQAERVRAQLRGLGDEGLAMLKQMMAPRDQASRKKLTKLQDWTKAKILPRTEEQQSKDELEFEQAWTRMLARFDGNSGSVLPGPGDKFGTGDLIPLVDNHDRIVLYRHGYKAPDRYDVDRMQMVEVPGSPGAANIAVFPATLEPAATTHRGDVVQFNPRSGFGLSVELDIPLQTFGDKKVLEWNGMKYLLTPMPDSIQLPKNPDGTPMPMFLNGRGIDMITSLHDAMSKEAVDGMVNNFRNAIAYFGFDFMPYLQRFFGTKDGPSTLELLNAISLKSPKMSVSQVDELINTKRMATDKLKELSNLAAGYKNLAADSWVGRMQDEDSVDAQIARATVLYLMTRGSSPKDILQSGGFNDDSTRLDAQSLLMPRLFTQVFDNAPVGSKLRIEMFDRINEQLVKDLGVGYYLSQTWEFKAKHQNYAKNLVGMLQFAEAHSSGDNPIMNGMAFDERQSQDFSQHVANIAYQAIGAETAYGVEGPYKIDIARAHALAKGEGLARFEKAGEKDRADGGVWRMLTNIDRTDRSMGQRWRMDTPAEAARKNAAGQSVVQFRQKIYTDNEDLGWDADNRNLYEQAAKEVALALKLESSQAGVVDFWVRQILGAPLGPDHTGKEQGHVTAKAALQAVDDILFNVLHGYMPTLGAEVPLTHLHDLQMIYRANRYREDPWRPRDSVESGAHPAGTWDDWVAISLGSALTSDNLFDPLYLLALDGFMHGYQAATDSILDLPVSMDSRVSQLLLDPDTNDLLVSLEKNTNVLSRDNIDLDTSRQTLASMVGGNRVAGVLEAKRAPADEIQKRRDARRKWRKETGVPIPVDATMKNFRKNGYEWEKTGTATNALARMLTHLRVGTALLNPALWTSMGPEQWVRGTLDRAANILTGQATVGLTARGQAAMSGKLDKRFAKRLDERIAELNDALAAAKTDSERKTIEDQIDEVLSSQRLGAAFGFEARYTPEQLVKLKHLYKVMGSRNDFKAMVYKDLLYLRPHAGHVGKIEKWLESYAKFGARMQDPTYGMRADTLARRYVDGVLQHILADPLSQVLSVDQLIAALTTNPEYLEKQFPEAHRAGTNAIAQIRSLKQTVASQTLRGIYEPMSESSNAATNFLGNVILKLPLLFSGYAMNVATTITGMQGADQMLAMFLHGRTNALKHPITLIQRAQWAMQGKEIPADADKDFDMSSILEGIDLSRAFIRGGITHTGLFAMGMMAGGLGLSGEDDETKKRRRLASLQGAGFIYDPRAIENDFRNADAIFLDWAPAWIRNYFKVGKDADGDVRSMAQLHWTMKQFISPIIGMERFFETGDFRQVTWGFEDALGAFPLINTLMWDDAVSTAHEMAAMADAEAAKGGPTNLIASAGLLTNAVGVYERMLFENSFVNTLYTSMDRYDRDPYALPLRDSDGDIQRDIEGNARTNDRALEPYIDPETGEVREGYLGRSSLSGTLHSLTENRATMAAVMSIFTGLGDSDYLRKNMTIKTQEVEKPYVSKQTAKNLLQFLAQSQETGPAERVTAKELAQIWKTEAKNNGQWVDWAEIDRKAAAYVKANPTFEPMSFLNDKEKEQLTKSGIRGILQGLKQGSVKLGDPSLAGVYIERETREELQKEMMEELMQEGINMGLDQTAAATRMNRLWYGPSTDPSVLGLGDILWSKQIDYNDTAQYNQLNTTYVMGPDGKPWATGFTRDGLMGALGVKPLKRAYLSEQAATGEDIRLNTTDWINRLNTGMRALELSDESRNIPTDQEIGESIERALAEAANKEYTPYSPYDKKSGGGYSRYGRRRGGGGYGGGGGGGYAQFQRMYSIPGDQAPYANSIPTIGAQNPIIRRADVRRERVWSERGRLMQWQ